jgi:hypothetical protein
MIPECVLLRHSHLATVVVLTEKASAGHSNGGQGGGGGGGGGGGEGNFPPNTEGIIG